MKEDPLSTTLVNIGLEQLIKDKQGRYFLHKNHQCLAVGHDVLLIATSRSELKQVTDSLIKAATEKVLEINEKKGKSMELRSFILIYIRWP